MIEVVPMGDVEAMNETAGTTVYCAKKAIVLSENLRNVLWT